MCKERKVSIIVPCYNEVKYIKGCIDSLLKQELPAGFKLQLLVSDGGSVDGTLDVLGQYDADERVQIINNERKYQVYALNQMLSLAEGEFIVRCDAHAQYDSSYVFALVSWLIDNPKVGNVGGEVVTKPGGGSIWAEAVCLAQSAAYGVGGGHRTIGLERVRCVDTVLFGAWRKTIFEEVGLFDSDLVRGQDYEHNLRIRKYGYEIKQIGQTSLTYYTRPTLKQAGMQVYQYAAAKVFIFYKHKCVPTARSLAPSIFYSALFLLGAAWLPLAVFYYGIYLGVLGLFIVNDRRIKSFRLAMAVMATCVVMHMSHFLGTIRGGVHLLFMRSRSVNWGGTR